MTVPAGFAGPLPVGISFFTFTQLGYLMDCRHGIAKDRNLLDYVVFVTFFPHLIAGPILHNGEMMPQFADPATYRFNPIGFAVGVGIFVGLTAWDTQSIKQQYYAGDGYEMAQKKSIFGALRLYLDFINIFTALLQLTGSSRNN